jgi:predicted MFS family arabinose efflux permease
MPAPRGIRRGGADPLGVLLLAAALLAVLVPLVQGRELGWPLWTVVLVAGAVPLSAVFVAQQRFRARRGREPLVRLDLFRGRGLPVGLLVTLVFFGGMGAFFVLTLHLQNGLHYSPLKTALTVLPATVGIVLGNGLGMPLAATLGRRLPLAGLVLLLAGTGATILAVALAGPTLSPWQLAAPVVVYGAGLGVGSSSLMLITLSGVAPADAGVASGMVNTTVQLGLAAGPAILGTVYFGRLAGGSGPAAQASLAVGLGLFAVASLLCLLLPRRKPAVLEPDHQAGAVREDVTS